MFDALRKILINDDWNAPRRNQEKEAKWWLNLREGSTLRFGLLPAPEVSAKEYKVRGSTRYAFGETSFNAYTLVEIEGQTLQLIVAEGGERETYLAISRPLQPRDIERLFAEEDAKRIYQKDLPRRLYARENTPGLREWVTMQYRCQLMGMKGKKEEQGKFVDFEYALFVNDGNSKAIEFEYAADGRLQVYVTLYRPLSDVIMVKHPPLPKPPAPSVVEVKPQPKVEAPAPKAEVVPHPAVTKKKEKETRVHEKGPALSKREHVAEPSPTAQPLSIREETEKFSCDIKIAARLIDEAVRNNLPLADVVRKILGLKLDVNEKVTFALPLSKEDYRTLALRYQVEPTDHPAIFHHIGEEIKSFAGDRNGRK
ncbi:MAG: hypothetical protein U1E36_07235 [Rickettsiales bacterium]